MKKIFFQGDSITDAGRNKSDNHNLSGFSYKVARALGDSYEYVNYGLSGDTTRHVLNRHKNEFLKERPDYLVLMIGINDVWRHFDGHLNDAVSKEECISNIIDIINISKNINPDVKIIFIEPYLVPGSNQTMKNAGAVFNVHLSEIRKNISSQASCYIQVQEEFYDLTIDGKPVSDDGVHPNEFGQEKIAEKIVTAIKELN